MNTAEHNKEKEVTNQLISKVNAEYKKICKDDIEVLFLISCTSCKKRIIDLGREEEFIADVTNFVINHIPKEYSDFFSDPLESEELKDKFEMDFKIYIRKTNTQNAWSLL
ncbi:MAG: hypothetical protein J6C49_07270 [Elusimicrobiaceae bacterium]|nr:hypothetical protein [Elusimicrobiaceae bacterium]